MKELEPGVYNFDTKNKNEILIQASGRGWAKIEKIKVKNSIVKIRIFNKTNYISSRKDVVLYLAQFIDKTEMIEYKLHSDNSEWYPYCVIPIKFYSKEELDLSKYTTAELVQIKQSGHAFLLAVKSIKPFAKEVNQ